MTIRALPIETSSVEHEEALDCLTFFLGVQSVEVVEFFSDAFLFPSDLKALFSGTSNSYLHVENSIFNSTFNLSAITKPGSIYNTVFETVNLDWTSTVNRVCEVMRNLYDALSS